MLSQEICGLSSSPSVNEPVMNVNEWFAKVTFPAGLLSLLPAFLCPISTSNFAFLLLPPLQMVPKIHSAEQSVCLLSLAFSQPSFFLPPSISRSPSFSFVSFSLLLQAINPLGDGKIGSSMMSCPSDRTVAVLSLVGQTVFSDPSPCATRQPQQLFGLAIDITDRRTQLFKALLFTKGTNHSLLH